MIVQLQGTDCHASHAGHGSRDKQSFLTFESMEQWVLALDGISLDVDNLQHSKPEQYLAHASSPRQ